MRHNDILWKGVLEWVFEDLLRFLFPEADQVFDLERGLIFLDKELLQISPEPQGQTTIRHVDKLAKVYRKDGTEEWVLIHLEIQGNTKAADRPFFGERMFRYFNQLFATYNRPIAAIAIFSGTDGHLLPDRFEYVFMNTQLKYQYNTLNIQDYSDEELSKSDNPFSWVVLIAKQALLTGKELDRHLLQGKLFVFRKLYENEQLGKNKINAILLFLNRYVGFENEETNLAFKKEVDLITSKNKSMDYFKLYDEIVAKEKVEERVIQNLLTTTKISPERIASILEVSIKQVRQIQRKLKAKKKSRNTKLKKAA